jgi:hypothetical protein
MASSIVINIRDDAQQARLEMQPTSSDAGMTGRSFIVLRNSGASSVDAELRLLSGARAGFSFGSDGSTTPQTVSVPAESTYTAVIQWCRAFEATGSQTASISVKGPGRGRNTVSVIVSGIALEDLSRETKLKTTKQPFGELSANTLPGEATGKAQRSRPDLGARMAARAQQLKDKKHARQQAAAKASPTKASTPASKRSGSGDLAMLARARDDAGQSDAGDKRPPTVTQSTLTAHQRVFSQAVGLTCMLNSMLGEAGVEEAVASVESTGATVEAVMAQTLAAIKGRGDAGLLGGRVKTAGTKSSALLGVLRGRASVRAGQGSIVPGAHGASGQSAGSGAGLSTHGSGRKDMRWRSEEVAAETALFDGAAAILSKRTAKASKPVDSGAASGSSSSLAEEQLLESLMGDGPASESAAAAAAAAAPAAADSAADSAVLAPMCMADELRSRANAVRQRAFDLWHSDIVQATRKSIEQEVTVAGLAAREERQLHNDITLRQTVSSALLQYHPAWLRVCLETMTSKPVQFSSRSVVDGGVTALRRHLMEHVLGKDEAIAATFRGTPKGEFDPAHGIAQSAAAVARVFTLVHMLDAAHSQNLLRGVATHRLFRRGGEIKSTSEMVTSLARDLLAQESNPLAHLRRLGMPMHANQSAMEEVDISIRCLSTDLRDGLVLGRLVEVLRREAPFSFCEAAIRWPAVNKSNKEGNVNRVLSALKESGVDLSECPPPSSPAPAPLTASASSSAQSSSSRGVAVAAAVARCARPVPITAKAVVAGNVHVTMTLVWRIVDTIIGFSLASEQAVETELLRLASDNRFADSTVRALAAPVLEAMGEDPSTAATMPAADAVTAAITGPPADAEGQAGSLTPTQRRLAVWLAAAAACSSCAAPSAMHSHSSEWAKDMSDGAALIAAISHYRPWLNQQEEAATAPGTASLRSPPKPDASAACLTTPGRLSWEASAGVTSSQWKLGLQEERAAMVRAVESAVALGGVPIMLPPATSLRPLEPTVLTAFLGFAFNRCVDGSARHIHRAATVINRAMRMLCLLPRRVAALAKAGRHRPKARRVLAAFTIAAGWGEYKVRVFNSSVIRIQCFARVLQARAIVAELRSVRHTATGVLKRHAHLVQLARHESASATATRLAAWTRGCRERRRIAIVRKQAAAEAAAEAAAVEAALRLEAAARHTFVMTRFRAAAWRALRQHRKHDLAARCLQGAFTMVRLVRARHIIVERIVRIQAAWRGMAYRERRRAGLSALDALRARWRYTRFLRLMRAEDEEDKRTKLAQAAATACRAAAASSAASTAAAAACSARAANPKPKPKPRSVPRVLQPVELLVDAVRRSRSMEEMREAARAIGDFAEADSESADLLAGAGALPALIAAVRAGRREESHMAAIASALQAACSIVQWRTARTCSAVLNAKELPVIITTAMALFADYRAIAAPTMTLLSALVADRRGVHSLWAAQDLLRQLSDLCSACRQRSRNADRAGIEFSTGNPAHSAGLRATMREFTSILAKLESKFNMELANGRLRG